MLSWAGVQRWRVNQEQMEGNQVMDSCEYLGVKGVPHLRGSGEPF